MTEVRARRQAAIHYKRGDVARWVAAFWCAQVVERDGVGEKGATIGLALDMGVSRDTVENLAHAYWIYSDLRKVEKYRHATALMRKMPTSYYSHFRALYDARRDYNLTLAQVFDIVTDVYQGEGSISSRDIDQHARDRFGVANWSKELRRLKAALKRAKGNKMLARKDKLQMEKVIKTLGKRLGE